MKNRSIIKQLGGNQINGGVVRGTIFTTCTNVIESLASLTGGVQVQGQSEPHLRPVCDQSCFHYNWNPQLSTQSPPFPLPPPPPPSFHPFTPDDNFVYREFGGGWVNGWVKGWMNE